jgi:hypothetical protein
MVIIVLLAAAAAVAAAAENGEGGAGRETEWSSSDKKIGLRGYDTCNFIKIRSSSLPDRGIPTSTGSYIRYAWAGGTFFSSCQFSVLAGNRFGFTYSLCTESTIQLWCCVSFF